MSITYKRLLFAIFVGIVLTTTIIGCGPGVVATINGTKITRQEYYNRLERLPVPAAGNKQAEAGAVILQRLIDEELVLRLAEKEKVSPTDRQVEERLAQVKKRPNFAANLKTAGLTLDQFKQMLRVEQAAFNLQTKGVELSDKDVRDAYEQNKSTQFTVPAHSFVAGIFAKSKADADKALGLLDKKNIPFATVASMVSGDPNSRANGGRLEKPIVENDETLPKSIRDLVLGTPVGKHTKPIPGGNGTFVIFQPVQHVKKKVQRFDEVSYAIRQQMMVQKGMEKKNSLDADLAKFRDEAKIEVRIDRYKKLVLPEKSGEKKSDDKKTK